MSKKVNKKQSRSAIGYSGNVTVKILHGNKVVSVRKLHNQGREGLFRFIAHCLGNNYFDREAPRYLRTFYSDVSVDEGNIASVLIEDNQISDIVAFSSIEYPEASKVDFTFLVPSSQINNNSGDAMVNVLALYSSESFSEAKMNDPSAYVYLGEDDEIEISSGSNLVIIWELSIENIVVEGE